MQRKRLEEVQPHVNSVYLTMDDFMFSYTFFPTGLHFLNKRLIILKVFLKVY